MNKITGLLLILFFFSLEVLMAQEVKDFWSIGYQGNIVLAIDSTSQLPHKDNIEMAGKKVAAILFYKLDKNQNLFLELDLIFPQLRIYNKTNEPDWKKYRAYFRRKVDKEMQPQLSLGNKNLQASKIDSIEINGTLTFHHQPVEGLKITKQFYPSMDDRLFIEEWTIENIGNESRSIEIGPVKYSQHEKGYKGNYQFIVRSEGDKNIDIAPGKSYSFPVYYGATLNSESDEVFNFQKAKDSRAAYLKTCKNELILKTPDPILNKLFHFSKIRAAESIFDSSMGLIHSPGGGNYYLGTWANDQVEYSGPFFPYMNYSNGHIAAYNTYKKFLENIPEDDHHIPYAFEVDGNFPMTHLDRGDAAMIVYGTSLYLLNSGNKEQAIELWPLIEWSIEYCHKKRNQAGVVASESDEMEGRIETGDANLSTSSLYFGGLKYAQIVAQQLGKKQLAKRYKQRAIDLELAIENYFGQEIEGLKTYRYFDGNKYLRHWICLPLTMGIERRKEGTLKALFEKLWTDNGILVQYDQTAPKEDQTFWDRATLYALRAAFKAGETGLAYEKISQYSRKRLLGDHVPYAVEAYPENNMKHLSAESALYCRIYIEGLFGIEPTGFSSFKMNPRLPENWGEMSLSRIQLMGRSCDLIVRKMKDKIQVIVFHEDQELYNKAIEVNEVVEINF